MKKTIFEYLEETANVFPNKPAFVDSNREISYEHFVKECKSIATNLLDY